GLLIGQNDFDFYLRQEIDRVFAATVDFSVALLPAKAFDLANGHAFDADAAQGVFDLLELEWFYYRFDFLHQVSWYLCFEFEPDSSGYPFVSTICLTPVQTSWALGVKGLALPMPLGKEELLLVVTA